MRLWGQADVVQAQHAHQACVMLLHVPLQDCPCTAACDLLQCLYPTLCTRIGGHANHVHASEPYYHNASGHDTLSVHECPSRSQAKSSYAFDMSFVQYIQPELVWPSWHEHFQAAG